MFYETFRFASSRLNCSRNSRVSAMTTPDNHIQTIGPKVRNRCQSKSAFRSSIPRYARTDFRQSKTDGSTKRSSSSVPSLKKVPSSSWKRGDFDVYCAAPVSGCASFASAGNLISLISLNFENVDSFFILNSVSFSIANTMSISSDFG